MDNPLNKCFLYHSVIADDAGPDCVADIVKVARQFNGDNGITGLLVFDGMRFCQYIEGPEPPLMQLVGRLQLDARHTGFTPVLLETLAEPRRFHTWSMAYAYVDDDDPLAAFARMDGPQALQYLLGLSGELDAA